MKAMRAVVVGAGVVGCAIARELTGKGAKVVVLDKAPDFGAGASGHNSGVIHSGFNYPKGMLKARLNKRGNEVIYGLCHELGVRVHMTGTLVVAQEEGELGALEGVEGQA